MFERLTKPFLTVETGEAYQPVRLAYQMFEEDSVREALNKLGCLEKKQSSSWSWLWQNECDDLHFESLDSFVKTGRAPIRLGTVTVRDKTLYINLPSFKRACLAVPFFYRYIHPEIGKIKKADFLNKVFGLDERLPHGFSELFKENELEQLVKQRVEDYEKVKELCEEAETADEAFKILSDYTQNEGKKRLPYAERYIFEISDQSTDPDILFLGFYIFLRGRELVAIRRWFGETGYTIGDVIDETVNEVFGNMDIEIIE